MGVLVMSQDSRRLRDSQAWHVLKDVSAHVPRWRGEGVEWHG